MSLLVTANLNNSEPCKRTLKYSLFMLKNTKCNHSENISYFEINFEYLTMFFSQMREKDYQKAMKTRRRNFFFNLHFKGKKKAPLTEYWDFVHCVLCCCSISIATSCQYPKSITHLPSEPE